MEKTNVCATCRFLQERKSTMPYHDKRNIGTCQRYAPRPSMAVNTSDSSSWPWMWSSDWCGEFEASEKQA